MGITSFPLCGSHSPSLGQLPLELDPLVFVRTENIGQEHVEFFPCDVFLEETEVAGEVSALEKELACVVACV